MDQKSREEFNRITALTPESLTQFDIDFLYARRSYLNKTQKAEFEEVLKIKAEKVKQASETKEE